MRSKKCQLCNSSKLKEIINLGHHPLADSFLRAEMVDDAHKVFPLKVLMCTDCGHAMLGYIVSGEDRYQKIEYSYTASNSPVSVKHFGEMASTISSLVSLSKEDLVVDIGSNDGTLLKHFKDQSGVKVMGVDPSANIAKIARKRGIPTIQDFFTTESAKELLQKTKAKAKVVTATNTLNHATDIQGFVKNISRILRPDGIVVFEVPHFLDLIVKGAFDTIYLEHISYFNVKPFQKFFKKHGLYIMRLESHEYMGGSIRVYLSKDKKLESKHVQEYIKKETEHGIYNLETYRDFMKRIEKFKFDLCKKILDVKAQGKKIVAIGAATKGNTLMNYCKIDTSMIDFVTDSSALKIGKYMPGSHIPIKPDNAITSDISHALILPWNIADFLVKKLGHLNVEFIIPEMKYK